MPNLTPLSMEYPGNLFVVAAPSGAGKSSLVRGLLAADPQVQLSVSHTTRAPRGQERDGREYHFVSKAVFAQMVADGEFVEWAEVHGNSYGTAKSKIEQRMADGGDVLLEIDYQGALQIKNAYSNAVLIFILPPSFTELRARLVGRGEDSAEVIALRMHNAEVEVAQSVHFDFVIINSSFESALFDLQSVVHAQRLKYAAQARARASTFQALNLS